MTTPGAPVATANSAVPPPPLRRWNWGAFFLNWIWGLGNRTPIALLTLLPPLCFVMPFVLGAKGDGWAWHAGRWSSVAQFRRVQRRWAIAGFLVGVPAMLLALVSTAALFGALGPIRVDSRYVSFKSGSDEPGAMAEAAFRASPAVIEALGEPLDRYSSSGSQSMVNGSGEARYTITAAGPKGSGTASLKAQANFGEWSISSFTLDDGGRSIEVVPPPPAGARLARARITVAGSDAARSSLDVEQSKRFAAAVDFAHVVPGTVLGAVLVGPRTDGDAPSPLVRSKVTLDDDPKHDLATFDYEFEKGLAPGAYRVDLMVGDALAKSVPFTVTGPGSSRPGPADGNGAAPVQSLGGRAR